MNIHKLYEQCQTSRNECIEWDRVLRDRLTDHMIRIGACIEDGSEVWGVIHKSHLLFCFILHVDDSDSPDDMSVSLELYAEPEMGMPLLDLDRIKD